MIKMITTETMSGILRERHGYYNDQLRKRD